MNNVIYKDDKGYPRLLKKTGKDAPKQLYYKISSICATSDESHTCATSDESHTCATSDESQVSSSDESNDSFDESQVSTTTQAVIIE